MELELNFKYAGIDWEVAVDVNDEWGLEQIFEVKAYDKANKKYIKIDCDLQEFEYAMQDQLNDCIDEERKATEEFWAENAFEQAREEKML